MLVLDTFNLEAGERLDVCLEPSLEGEYANPHQPRCWSSPPFS